MCEFLFKTNTFSKSRYAALDLSIRYFIPPIREIIWLAFGRNFIFKADLHAQPLRKIATRYSGKNTKTKQE